MWEPVDVDTFGQCWTAECDELSQNPNRERFFLATGRLLPIWNLLGDDPEVRRLVTADGSALLGRIVPHGVVHTLLGKLGLAGALKLAPAGMLAAAWEGKTALLDRNPGLILERPRLNGEHVLQPCGIKASSLPATQEKAHFNYIIQLQKR